MRLRKIRLAYAWLTIFTTTLISWITLIIIHPDQTQPLILKGFLSLSGSPTDLTLRLNLYSWLICLSTISILLAYLLTSITNLDGNKSLIDWIVTVVCLICGNLIALAGDYWMILVGWTLFDLIELALLFIYKCENQNNLNRHIVLKFTGSILLVYSISRSYSTTRDLAFVGMFNSDHIFLLLAALLHSGMFTYNRLYSGFKENRRKIPLIIFPVISFLASFYFLVNAQQVQINTLLAIILKILLVVWLIIVSVGLIRSREKYKVQQYILYIATGLIGYAYFSGLIVSLPLLMMCIFVPFLWAQLYTHSSMLLRILDNLSLVLFSGLPLSIPSFIFNQVGSQATIADLIVIISFLSILIGKIFVNQTEEMKDIESLDPWFQFFYYAGIFLLISSSIWMIYRLQRSASIGIDNWWLNVFMPLSAILCAYIAKRSAENNKNDLVKSNLFKRERIYRLANAFVKTIFTISKRIFKFIIGLFEGEGGILWAVVVLALFLTLLSLQGRV